MRILAGAGAVLLCAFAASAATPAPRTTLVSVALGGKWANASSWSARVSGDGRFVVFFSAASNLTRAPRGGFLFVRDRRRGRTVRLGSGGVDLAVTPGARFVVVCTTAPLARGDEDAPYGRPPEVERFLDAYVYDRRTGRILRASVPVRGRNPNDRGCGGEFAGHVDVSADGRYVLFPAKASNIVRGDTNGRVDVFVRDLQARRTRRVSVTSSGAQAIGDSSALAISGDGRFAFFCGGANMGRAPGVFVHDLRTRRTRAVSTAADGRPLSQVICLHGKVVSADGRFVAFATKDPGVTRSGDYRLVVKDRRTGALDLLTPGVDGEGVGGVHAAAMSASGRYLTFATSASNLVSGDTNNVEDVFWFDRTRRATVRLSLRWDGSESFTQFGSDWPAISANGRWVTWQTSDSSFMPGEPHRPIGEETQGPLHPRSPPLASARISSASWQRAAPACGVPVRRYVESAR